MSRRIARRHLGHRGGEFRRPTDLARLGAGVLVLARPGWVVHATGSPDGPWVRGTVRILGARYVAQAVFGSAAHRPWVRVVDTGVDVIHAVSMVGFAAAMPRHRRLALLSAVTALGFAALDWHEEPR
jgi:hypothetical protein